VTVTPGVGAERAASVAFVQEQRRIAPERERRVSRKAALAPGRPECLVAGERAKPPVVR
jgi:hypothetical protein